MDRDVDLGQTPLQHRNQNLLGTKVSDLTLILTKKFPHLTVRELFFARQDLVFVRLIAHCLSIFFVNKCVVEREIGGELILNDRFEE